MKRGGRLPRYTELARGPMKRKARKPSEFARIFGSKARVQWIKSLPCVGCGVVGFSDNAHVCGNEGMSRKGHHTTIAPLCHDRGGVTGCHTVYDKRLRPFNTKSARDAIRSCARRTAEAWVARVERA